MSPAEAARVRGGARELRNTELALSCAVLPAPPLVSHMRLSGPARRLLDPTGAGVVWVETWPGARGRQQAADYQDHNGTA